MKPEIKAAWIAALRSGEYSQTTGHLRDDVGYCCLGVLCDLAAKEGIGQWTDDGTFLTGGEMDNNSVPPDNVVVWAGLQSPNPLIEPEGGYHLAIYNDGAPWAGIKPHSFAEIASLIEQEL